MKEILKTEVISIGDFVISLGNMVNAIIIFIAAYFLIYIISFLITRSFKRRNRPDGRHLSIIQLLKYFVWTLTIVFMLQSLGINITFLIASSAALLVGIGLGLQSVFKDFISGIILLIEGTIKVEDVVEVGGMVVQVKEISIRTSKVVSREDINIIIPNHKFIEDNVINWTHNSMPTRFLIEVGVDYASNAGLVESVLKACAASHADVIQEESFKPSVRLQHFGNSSLDFQLFFYSYNLFRIENVKSQLRFKILEEFRSNKIIIPFPQHVVHYANKVEN